MAPTAAARALAPVGLQTRDPLLSHPSPRLALALCALQENEQPRSQPWRGQSLPSSELTSRATEPALQAQAQQSPSQGPEVPVLHSCSRRAKLWQEDAAGSPTQSAGSPDPPSAAMLDQLPNTACKSSNRAARALLLGQRNPEPFFWLRMSYFSQSPGQHEEGQVRAGSIDRRRMSSS